MGIWSKKPIATIRTNPDTPVSPSVDLKIEISQSAGTVRVSDPRLFRDDRREWCRALADSASTGRDVRAVRLNLETAACEIQFVAQASAHVMASVLAESMRAADQPRRSNSPYRRGWFTRRSPEPLAWTYLAAFPGEASASIWATRFAEPGLIEIDHSSLPGSEGARTSLTEGLLSRFQTLSSCQVDRRTGRLEVRFEPGRIRLAELLNAAECVLAGMSSGSSAVESDGLPAVSSPQEPTILVTGPRRLFFLALGGGAFVMIFVGLTIPGIPTVTFAMISSYYLARSSILLHGRLVRSSFFEPMLREWSQHHGLSLVSKTKLFFLTMGLVGLSFILVGITPVVLTVTFVLTTAGLVGLVRLPGLEEEPRQSLTESPIPALPSPA
jgi:uncharacterized protein